MVDIRLIIIKGTVNVETYINILLGVAIQTGFLHGINGIPQKFMGILLAAKAKVSGNFC